MFHHHAGQKVATVAAHQLRGPNLSQLNPAVIPPESPDKERQIWMDYGRIDADFEMFGTTRPSPAGLRCAR